MRYRPKSGDRFSINGTVMSVVRRVTPGEAERYQIRTNPGVHGAWWWIQSDRDRANVRAFFFGVAQISGNIVDLTEQMVLLERDGHSALS